MAGPGCSSPILQVAQRTPHFRRAQTTLTLPQYCDHPLLGRGPNLDPFSSQLLTACAGRGTACQRRPVAPHDQRLQPRWPPAVHAVKQSETQLRLQHPDETAACALPLSALWAAVCNSAGVTTYLLRPASGGDRCRAHPPTVGICVWAEADSANPPPVDTSRAVSDLGSRNIPSPTRPALQNTACR